MKGVYIIKFEIYPGIYKVGCSKNIEKRFQQIKNDSIILGKVELLYCKKFANYKKAEKEIHKKLKKYRVQENREFFKVNWKIIKTIIDSTSDKTIPSESNSKLKNISDLMFNWMLNNCYRRDLNEIILTAKRRKDLCSALNINNNQITNGLSSLKKKRTIFGEKGTFTVNPEIFWKGDATSRREVLKDKSLKVSFELIENNDK